MAAEQAPGPSVRVVAQRPRRTRAAQGCATMLFVALGLILLVVLLFAAFGDLLRELVSAPAPQKSVETQMREFYEKRLPTYLYENITCTVEDSFYNGHDEQEARFFWSVQCADRRRMLVVVTRGEAPIETFSCGEAGAFDVKCFERIR